MVLWRESNGYHDVSLHCFAPALAVYGQSFGDDHFRRFLPSHREISTGSVVGVADVPGAVFAEINMAWAREGRPPYFETDFGGESGE